MDNNNIIDFLQKAAQQSGVPGEYVMMPFVVYLPVFVPAVAATPQTSPSSASVPQKPGASPDKQDNVVSIYDYLGEI